MLLLQLRSLQQIMIDVNIAERLTLPLFKLIQDVGEEIHQPVYVVGGWVRDLFLERASKDVDIVTLGSGLALAEKLAEKLSHDVHVSYFKNFGTAMLRFQDWEIEFVGARKESYSRNSRKPIVEDGSIEDDQKRRDFTINAMSISLNKDTYGELIDPFNGLEDLNKKILRTPLDPEITFSDDPLRMMRAIRFASQLQFEIDPEALKAISKNTNRLQIVSAERISEELNKIMMSNQPSVGFSLLFKSGLLNEILPELADLHGVEEVNGMKHKDNFYHTLEVVDNVSRKSDNLWLRYAALFHDIGKAKTKKHHPKNGWSFHGHEYLGSKMVPLLFKRLRLPTDHKMRFVKKLVALSSRPIALVSDDASDSGVRRLLFDAGDDIDNLMDLCEADITTKNPVKMKRYLQNFQKVREKLKEVEEKDHVRNFQPPVDGNEIAVVFGIEPGREIGIIKNAVKEAILDGEIENNREQAWQLILKLALEMKMQAVQNPII